MSPNSQQYASDTMAEIEDSMALEPVSKKACLGRGAAGASAGMADLPESCIASCLRFTTPRDVARLACVSRIFRAASQSDLVWERMLPPGYADVLAEAEDPPSNGCSKKEIYEFLCSRVLLQNGTRDYWLDRATGGICQSVGALGLRLEGDEEGCWDWDSILEGSRFETIAYLKLIWGLQIDSELECTLSPGPYTVTWRLFEPFGRNVEQVTFSVEATGNELVKVDCKFPIRRERTSKKKAQKEERSLVCRGDDREWIELDVAEFMVDGNSPVVVKCSMMAPENGVAKSGLYLDGVVIRPSNLIPTEVWRLWGCGNQSPGETRNGERPFVETYWKVL